MSEPKPPIEGEVVSQPTPTAPVEQDDALALLIVSKNPAGRPTKMTVAVVSKLLAALNNDYTIQQACAYAGIGSKTYYRWCEENKYFRQRMSEAKDMPLRRAREVVIGAINAGDANLGFRFLERRDPEYKPKAEVDNKPELTETREKIKEFLDDDDSSNAGSEQPTTADSETARGEVAEAPTDIS